MRIKLQVLFSSGRRYGGKLLALAQLSRHLNADHLTEDPSDCHKTRFGRGQGPILTTTSTVVHR